MGWKASISELINTSYTQRNRHTDTELRQRIMELTHAQEWYQKFHKFLEHVSCFLAQVFSCSRHLHRIECISIQWQFLAPETWACVTTISSEYSLHTGVWQTQAVDHYASSVQPTPACRPTLRSTPAAHETTAPVVVHVCCWRPLSCPTPATYRVNRSSRQLVSSTLSASQHLTIISEELKDFCMPGAHLHHLCEKTFGRNWRTATLVDRGRMYNTVVS